MPSSRVPNGHWTPERVVEALRRDARRRGRSPRSRDWKRSAGRRHPSSQTVHQLWPSWDGALRAAGLEPYGGELWTRAAIIVALQQDARRRGEPPTSLDWEASPGPRGKMGRRRPTAETVKARFGSWSAALCAAGLEPRGTGERRWPVRRTATNPAARP
jgi:Homing endonuclease associated repeat